MASSAHKLLLLLLSINALSENVMCFDSEDSHGIDVKEEEVKSGIEQGPSLDVKKNLEIHDVSPLYHSYPLVFSKEDDEVIKDTNEESIPSHDFTENNKEPRNLEVPMYKGTVNNPDNASPSEDAKVPIKDTPNGGESFKDSNVDHEHSKSTEYKIPLETWKFETDDKQIPYYTKVILDKILESLKENDNTSKALVDKEPSREDVLGDQDHPILTKDASSSVDTTVEEQHKGITSHDISEKEDYLPSGDEVMSEEGDTLESVTEEGSDHVKRDTSDSHPSVTEDFDSHDEDSTNNNNNLTPEEMSKMFEGLEIFLTLIASAQNKSENINKLSEYGLYEKDAMNSSYVMDNSTMAS